MTDQAQHKFSITMRTEDFTAVGYLRALANFSQKVGNDVIPRGAIEERDWTRARQCVTFRFSAPEYRDGFLSEVQRLLPESTWKLVGMSDDDRSTRQRR